MKNKVFYYSDPVNDDFAENNIETKPTPADYVYIPRSPAFRAAAFLLYEFAARPLTYVFIKAVYHQRFVNKAAFKKRSGAGCFIFGNHTLAAGDAFIPNHMTARKNYIVTSPDATSIKGIGTIVKMFGAIPVPSTVSGTKKFTSAVGELIEKGKTVTIYPEAHIWPYYTGIRPFKEDPFRLPVMSDAPCYSFTNVYLKSRNPFRKRPVIKTYINGPFYPDKSLPQKERIKDLRNKVYESMVKEAEKQEQYVTNVYIKK